MRIFPKHWKSKWPENVKRRSLEYYLSNKNKILKRARKWRKRNKILLRSSSRKKFKRLYQTDPLFRMKHRIRGRLAYTFRQIKRKKPTNSFNLLGCSPQKIKRHLEKQFKPGMTWGNSGKRWHIDHIKPIASGKTLKQVIKLCHYTNLQPLWKMENLRKSHKIQNP